MVVLLESQLSPKEIDTIRKTLQGKGLWCSVFKSENGQTALKAKCPTDFSLDSIRELPGVQQVLVEVSSTPLVNRNGNEDQILQVGPHLIGGSHLTLIAGPCAVESRQHIFEMAHQLKELRIPFLRGGAFKPRTSPYSFQGTELQGLEWMREAADTYELKVVSEIISPELVEMTFPLIDIYQVGARNMQNFALLKELSHQTHPILLKRGMGSTIEEWLGAGEYLLQNKGPGVLFCERGIRSFENSYRNIFDINAIPFLRRETHYPVIADPSHACGDRRLIPKLACAAIAAGAQGLILEVHSNPSQALSDGPQALSLHELEELLPQLYDFFQLAQGLQSLSLV